MARSFIIRREVRVSVRLAAVCCLALLACVAMAAPPAVEKPSGATAAVSSSSTGSSRIELSDAADGAQRGFVVRMTPQELAAWKALSAPQRAGLVRVTVINDLPHPPALAGVATEQGGQLRFTPRYPLDPRVRYRVVFNATQLDAKAAGPIQADLALAAPRLQAPTRVAQIYPSADKLPANQLKFYLHFSSPMGRGQAYRHLHLLDRAGKEIEGAFLELGEELWDPAQRRFTLLFDPARVKRGLKPREELGAVLVAGQTYTLVVDADWRDAQGEPLAAEARKTFEVIPPDEEPLNPVAWKIEPPRAGTMGPLVVRFGEPLDQALASRVLHVLDPRGQRMPGHVTLSEQETCWQFVPEQPWDAGSYRLSIDTTLEDLAGNAIGRAFDVDLFAPVQRQIKSDTVRIPFTVPAAGD